MAAEASEFPAVTDDAGLLIEVGFAAAVEVDIFGVVAGGLELLGWEVALLAGEGDVDFGMANEAVGHLGKHRMIGDFVVLHASMTGGA